MSSLITPQFKRTAIRLALDVSTGLGRDVKDPRWIGGFIAPMIGSLAHECGGFMLMEEGKPTVQGSLGGISFAQWTGMGAPRPGRPAGRRYLFMASCRSRKLHPYGYDAAIAFLLTELKGSAAHVVEATLSAPPLLSSQVSGMQLEPCDAALLGRVVKFEKLYEGAGVKHYPSRYAYAKAAADVIGQWWRDGGPGPDRFVMPKSRFSAQFDAEFGRGVTATTTRWDAIPNGTVISGASDRTLPIDDRTPMPEPGTSIPLPDGRELHRETASNRLVIRDVPTRAGRWPEGELLASEIRSIQQELRDRGYVKVGTVDGKWGPSTKAAIVMMQADAGIGTDGHWGPATRKALLDGVRHQVAPERAAATASVLLKAGEPTLTAVQPVASTSKVAAIGSSALALVSGVAQAWPQASSTVDAIKGYLADVPGWVWLIAVAVVALYIYVSTRQVKRVAVENYRSGASTALATPLPSLLASSAEAMPAQASTIYSARSQSEVSEADLGSEPDRPIVPDAPDGEDGPERLYEERTGSQTFPMGR